MSSQIIASTSSGTALNFSSDTSGVLEIKTGSGPTTAITVDASQRTMFPTTIGVGGATPSTSGSGITFPATQSASSDANTLDDYEEGTWTPIINTAGGGVTVVGTPSTGGSYTKIGRMVYLSGFLGASTSVSWNGAAVIVTGLPFSAATNPQQAGSAIVGATNAGSIVLAYTTNIYSAATTSATSYSFNVAYSV